VMSSRVFLGLLPMTRNVTACGRNKQHHQQQDTQQEVCSSSSSSASINNDDICEM
jgi:hypothetical protein